MAFWAFDKVKRIAGNLNIVQVGNRLKNYVVRSDLTKTYKDNEQPQDDPLRHNAKQVFPAKRDLTDEQRMQIQIHEYHKLVQLQDRLLEKEERAQRLQLQDLLDGLQASLRKEEADDQQRRKENRKTELVKKVSSGAKTVEQLIQQNILLKEKIYNKRSRLDQVVKRRGYRDNVN